MPNPRPVPKVDTIPTVWPFGPPKGTAIRNLDDEYVRQQLDNPQLWPQYRRALIEEAAMRWKALMDERRFQKSGGA